MRRHKIGNVGTKCQSFFFFSFFQGVIVDGSKVRCPKIGMKYINVYVDMYIKGLLLPCLDRTKVERVGSEWERVVESRREE